ncbi:MAG: beta-galactosidase, partial [Lachnospiraceae bacterium]|nr:beta-galactosidase [Lachnospiraceae bacterium]
MPASHFTLDEYAGPGVYIDTEEVPGGAFVTARAKVCGLKAGQKIALNVVPSEFVFTDEDPLTEVYAPAAEDNTLRTFIPDVLRWDPETDWQLYTAKLSLIEHNEVIDEISTDFGVRDFAIDAERGFILNGREYPLRGVCRHQDRLYEGSALSEEAAYEDAALIAEMGANTVRLAHYQQAQEM